MFQTLKSERWYRRLFFAGIINGVGDRFSQVALLALILNMTGSAMSVGITLAVRMLPFLLFGAFSSSAASTFSRKKLMMTTDLARAAIALSFLFVDSREDMWIVYAGSFLLAAGEALYAPARKAAIPAVADRNKLKEVNSWETVMLGFVLIVGALSGGIVSFFLGPKSAFIVNIASFLIAAAIISGIPTLEHGKNEQPEGKGETERKSLLPVLAVSPFLFLLVLGDFIFPLINGIENVLLSVYAIETFGAGDIGVGILYSVLGTGYLISPLITGRIKKAYLPLSFFCLGMEGTILALISQSPSFIYVVILFGVMTIFGGVGMTLLDTAIMETLPSKWHGPYFSFSAAAGNTLLGVSMFASGAALEFLEPRQLGLLGGSLYIVFASAFFIRASFLHMDKEKQVLKDNIM